MHIFLYYYELIYFNRIKHIFWILVYNITIEQINILLLLLKLDFSLTNWLKGGKNNLLLDILILQPPIDSNRDPKK